MDNRKRTLSRSSLRMAVCRKLRPLVSYCSAANGSIWRIKNRFRSWWWSSGQSPHLLLRWSEFESCWLLRILNEKTKIKHKESGSGPSFLNRFDNFLMQDFSSLKIFNWSGNEKSRVTAFLRFSRQLGKPGIFRFSYFLPLKSFALAHSTSDPYSVACCARHI